MPNVVPSHSMAYDTYGEPEDVLFVKPEEVPIKDFASDECLVSWMAAPVNPSDINQ
ncbi:hypothetical protein KIPB_015697, partial [Kipferlia bialata]|eukprot:g15697.t1